MEVKVKNRGWVKNAAIIFLTVMLILTFFSNTFMNRSLPEVATQNVASGSITARKIMAAFLTHPLFFTLTSMGFSPRQIEIKLQYRLP